VKVIIGFARVPGGALESPLQRGRITQLGDNIQKRQTECLRGSSAKKGEKENKTWDAGRTTAPRAPKGGESKGPPWVEKNTRESIP